MTTIDTNDSSYTLTECNLYNTSLVTYVSGRNLTDIPTTNNYNTSLSAYTNNQISLYNTSLYNYLDIQ